MSAFSMFIKLHYSFLTMLFLVNGLNLAAITNFLRGKNNFIGVIGNRRYFTMISVVSIQAYNFIGNVGRVFKIRINWTRDANGFLRDRLCYEKEMLYF